MIEKTDKIIHVYAFPHPIDNTRTEITIPAGKTITEILALLDEKLDSPIESGVVYLSGEPISEEHWSRIKPKPDSVLVVKAVAEGPLVAGIGALIGTISSSIFAATGGLTLFGKVLMAGISIAGNFLLNALFPARPPQLEQESNNQKASYSVSGSRNQAAPWEAVPVILGRHRVTPFFAAPQYTESQSEDQYLRCLFVWGYGVANVEDIRIGETPITQFQDVQIETSYGYGGAPDQPLTLYPRQTIEEQLSIDMKNVDGWHYRTTAENVDEISLDFVWPQGNYYISMADGKKHDLNFVVWVQARRLPDGAWFSLPTIQGTFIWTSTFRRTTSMVVPNGQYEVRAMKALADWPQDHDDTFVDSFAWVALRGLRNQAPVNFNKPLLMTAIRLRANAQLNGSLDQINGIVTSYVRDWNNPSVWRPSNNPADLFRHVLQGPANARPTPDSLIDIAALNAWWHYCKDQGFTFNQYRTSRASVFDTLLDICAAGRAVPYFNGNKFSVIWDQQDKPIVQMFTPRNSWGFEETREYRKFPHAYRARFINELKGYVEDERIVYDDGYDSTNATQFEHIEFPGVTNPNQIWRHGRFHIAQQRLRPSVYTLNVDIEALVCTRGDKVLVQHDVMLAGVGSGRVIKRNDDLRAVDLDEITTLDASKSYRLTARFPNGGFLQYPLVTGQGGELRTLVLGGVNVIPPNDTLVAVEEMGRELGTYRILSIEPGDEMSHRITLVDDAPAIYQADSGAIPPFVSNVTAPVNPFTLAPTNLVVSQELYYEGNEWLIAATLNWQVSRQGWASRFEIEYFSSAIGQWISAGSVQAPNTSYRIPQGLRSGGYTFRVRTVFTDGTYSRWTVTPPMQLDILTRAPAQVSDFRISVRGDNTFLNWSPVNNVPIGFYEIRFVDRDSSEIEWNAATPLIPRVEGTSIQVPSLVGTYLIKAVSVTGIRSVDATRIKSTIAELEGVNVVETLSEHPSFSGERDGTIVVDGRLKLALMEDTPGARVQGYYTFANALDLGAVFTSRTTAVVEAVGEDLTNVMAQWPNLASVTALDTSMPDEWGVELEVSTTLSDPASPDAEWTDWQPFVVGDVTARGYRFRVRLYGQPVEGSDPPYTSTTPNVSRLSVVIDMPDRVIAKNDLVAPSAGLQVSFDPPFIHLEGISTADQDLSSGDRKIISNKDENGFFIRFYNSSGNPISRTFDYVAKGYGSRIS